MIGTVGALEQHASHLPPSADIATQARVACGASSTLEPLRTTWLSYRPWLSYDVTGGRGPFTGLAELRTERLHLVKELLAEWVRFDDVRK